MLYNHEPWIEETLQSLKKQTYQNFNLLIVDDVSTDASYEIAKTMEGDFKNCEVIKNSQNKGVVDNFFDCLNMIESKFPNSKFFMWASPDDTWSPQYLEVTRNVLEKNSNAIVCQTGYEMIYVDDNKITYHTLPSLKKPTFRNAKQLFKSHVNNGIKTHYNGIIQGLIRFEDLRYVFPKNHKLLGHVLCIEISMMLLLFLRGEIETTQDIYYHRKKLGKFADKYPKDSFSQGRASLWYRIKSTCSCLPWMYRVCTRTKLKKNIPILWLHLAYHYILLFLYGKTKAKLRKIIK